MKRTVSPSAQSVPHKHNAMTQWYTYSYVADNDEQCKCVKFFFLFEIVIFHFFYDQIIDKVFNNTVRQPARYEIGNARLPNARQDVESETSTTTFCATA